MDALKKRCDFVCSNFQCETDVGFEKAAQEINLILLASRLQVKGIEIEPLWIETYFGTDECPGSSHHREEQRDRFCKYYYHTYGRGGVDLVLSTDKKIYFSVLLKACRINGQVYSQIKLKDYLKGKQIPEDSPVEIKVGHEAVQQIKNGQRVNVKKNPNLELASYLVFGEGPHSNNMEYVYRCVLKHARA